MMKRVTCIFLALAFTIVLAACQSEQPPAQEQEGAEAAAPAAPQKVITWKLGTIYNDPVARPEFNSFGEATAAFAKLVNEKSNGRLIVEPYYSSVLGASAELWGSVRNNEIQVFYGQPMSTADKRFGSWNIPYLFSDYAQVQKLIASPDAPLFKLAQQWMEEDGVHLAAIGTSVFRGYYNIKHEVAAIDDVRDLKTRTYEDKVVSAFWSDICNAISMAFSEVYTGLQTGAVDGLEFAASSVLSSKYYEIASPSYYSDINWQWTSGCNMVFSRDAWAELPDDLKQIVTEAAWAAQDVFHERETLYSSQALEELAKNGAVIRHLTDAERQTWIDHARSLDDQLKADIGEEAWNATWEAVKSAQ